MHPITAKCGSAAGAGLLALAILAGAALAASPDDTTRGHELVRRNCGVCHAIGTMDVSPNPIAPPFRILHERYAIGDLAEALAEGILTGHPQMPEFSFPPEDVNAIIDYLKSIQTHKGVERDAPGPAARRKGG